MCSIEVFYFALQVKHVGKLNLPRELKGSEAIVDKKKFQGKDIYLVQGEGEEHFLMSSNAKDGQSGTGGKNHLAITELAGPSVEESRPVVAPRQPPSESNSKSVNQELKSRTRRTKPQDGDCNYLTVRESISESDNADVNAMPSIVKENSKAKSRDDENYLTIRESTYEDDNDGIEELPHIAEDNYLMLVSENTRESDQVSQHSAASGTRIKDQEDVDENYLVVREPVCDDDEENGTDVNEEKNVPSDDYLVLVNEPSIESRKRPEKIDKKLNGKELSSDDDNNYLVLVDDKSANDKEMVEEDDNYLIVRGPSIDDDQDALEISQSAKVFNDQTAFALDENYLMLVDDNDNIRNKTEDGDSQGEIKNPTDDNDYLVLLTDHEMIHKDTAV